MFALTETVALEFVFALAEFFVLALTKSFLLALTKFHVLALTKSYLLALTKFFILALAKLSVRAMKKFVALVRTFTDPIVGGSLFVLTRIQPICINTVRVNVPSTDGNDTVMFRRLYITFPVPLI